MSSGLEHWWWAIRLRAKGETMWFAWLLSYLETGEEGHIYNENENSCI